MKLRKWEKDLCKAFVNMYIAKGIEMDENSPSRWLEHEVSRTMDDIHCDHRQAVEDYLLTLIK